jgi:hypothetical protein
MGADTVRHSEHLVAFGLARVHCSLCVPHELSSIFVFVARISVPAQSHVRWSGPVSTPGAVALISFLAQDFPSREQTRRPELGSP